MIGANLKVHIVHNEAVGLLEYMLVLDHDVVKRLWIVDVQRLRGKRASNLDHTPVYVTQCQGLDSNGIRPSYMWMIASYGSPTLLG